MYFMESVYLEHDKAELAVCSSPHIFPAHSLHPYKIKK